MIARCGHAQIMDCDVTSRVDRVIEAGKHVKKRITITQPLTIFIYYYTFYRAP